jgi:hypothetical protein
MDNYEEFLKERRERIADGINGYLDGLVDKEFVIAD